MQLEQEYARIAGLLHLKFGGALRHRSTAVREVVVILVLSLLLGWDTVHQVARRLGLSKDQLYDRLKALTLSDWQKLFSSAFEALAIEHLLEAQSKSAATWSRLEVVLSFDDSVVRKWGKLLSYLGLWWSGQFHRVLRGHDVVLLVLKVGKQVIPVGFWLMSKQGRLSNRHQRVGRLIEQLASRWKEAGIDLSRIPVSCDSGFADQELVEAIRKVGFPKVVMGVKGHYRLYPGRAKKQAMARSQALGRADFSREPGWALRETVGWCSGTSPTFGKVTVLARMMLGKVRRVFAFGVSRACEILRIWKAHHWIEEVFKRLKDLLHWGSYRLRGNTGAYAGIVIPFLAYCVLLMLQHRTGHTFAGICQAIQQWALKDIDSLLQTWSVEHFHLSLATTDQILKI